MHKYIDCPHCAGSGMEPENDDKLCSTCHGEAVIAAKHRVDTENENGSCDICGRKGVVAIEHDVYTNHEGKDNWEYKRSICEICSAQ